MKNSRGKRLPWVYRKNKPQFLSVKKKINSMQVQISAFKAAVQNTYFYVWCICFIKCRYQLDCASPFHEHGKRFLGFMNQRCGAVLGGGWLVGFPFTCCGSRPLLVLWIQSDFY